MMNKLFRATLIIAALVLAACGSVATPVWQAPDPTQQEAENVVEAVSTTVVEPTEIPPTNTPLPPTPTVTPEPPTATPIPPTPTNPPQDPITVLVSLSDPAQGKELFNTFYDQAGFACATCHRVDSEERLVGPGLFNIGTRAGTPGHLTYPDQVEAPERYMYESITNPNLFVVQDYAANLMPQVYQELFTDQQIYNIIAYLLTLK